MRAAEDIEGIGDERGGEGRYLVGRRFYGCPISAPLPCVKGAYDMRPLIMPNFVLAGHEANSLQGVSVRD